MKLWRNRRWLWGAVSEIGCGLLTIMLITIPLWVFTVAARGPGFALTMLVLLFAAVIGVAALGRWLKRR